MQGNVSSAPVGQQRAGQQPTQVQPDLPKATLSGHVFSDAGVALKRAQVSLRNLRDPNAGAAAVSDAQGAYTFTNVVPGSYMLQCSRTG
jgi:hypothetical protein